jgi:hypothetical protein
MEINMTGQPCERQTGRIEVQKENKRKQIGEEHG